VNERFINTKILINIRMDKTITVRENTWKRLTNLKTKLGLKTLDNLLFKILNVFSRLKLEKELE